MKKIIVAAALLVGTMVFSGTMVSAGAILSTAECEAIWNGARPGGSDMTAELAKPYVDDFKAVDTDGNNRIESNEFYAGCAKGLVHAASTPPARSDMPPK
jgi:hypothetical protein